LEVGLEVGLEDGCELGLVVGFEDGEALGIAVGLDDGDALGTEVGLDDGEALGIAVGEALGTALGTALGFAEGDEDGVAEGVAEGARVGFPVDTGRAQIGALQSGMTVLYSENPVEAFMAADPSEVGTFPATCTVIMRHQLEGSIQLPTTLVHPESSLSPVTQVVGSCP
jgi:hypothetical protein